MPGPRHPRDRTAAHHRTRGLTLALLLLGTLLLDLLRPASLRAADWLPAAVPGWDTREPVLLADGLLLVAGGVDLGANPAYLTARTAFYTATTDQWHAGNPLTTVRTLHVTTALPDGGALVTGGATSSTGFGVQTVERLDPATKEWRMASPMKSGRHSHTATFLASGNLLVVGGMVGGASPSNPVKPIASVELYDPATDTWEDAAPLATPRGAHRALLLADGSVLAIGGNGEQSVERYDPQANRWTSAGTMQRPRTNFTATMLHDGRVLIVGDAKEAEIYDPGTNSWTVILGPATQRSGHTATLLPTGEVLVVGGGAPSSPPTNTTERYDPATMTWRVDSPLINARAGHYAALIGGKLYVVDSFNGAEIYDARISMTQCFVETGRCVYGVFLAYWQANGGLPLNGYPLSEPFAERLENGKVYLVQYFERVRLEYHSEVPAPYTVQLGQFGRRIHPADPPVTPRPGERYFAETGHNVPEDFYAYWAANGGLPQFGFPLTEVITETLEDGKTYQVQYFERARFERHPENPAPYDILLGQFGRRILAGR